MKKNLTLPLALLCLAYPAITLAQGFPNTHNPNIQPGGNGGGNNGCGNGNAGNDGQNCMNNGGHPTPTPSPTPTPTPGPIMGGNGGNGGAGGAGGSGGSSTITVGDFTTTLSNTIGPITATGGAATGGSVFDSGNSTNTNTLTSNATASGGSVTLGDGALGSSATGGNLSLAPGAISNTATAGSLTFGEGALSSSSTATGGTGGNLSVSEGSLSPVANGGSLTLASGAVTGGVSSVGDTLATVGPVNASSTNSNTNTVAGGTGGALNLASGAVAGGSVGNTSASTAGSGNSNTVVSYSGGNTTIRHRRIPVATAYAPSMSSGIDTCSLGQSAGVTTKVFGIALGGTKRDKTCEVIKLSRTLDEQGYGLEACQILFNEDPRVARAFAVSGRTCHATIDVEELPPVTYPQPVIIDRETILRQGERG